MKKNTIICISREFGSGGREVGQQLSKKLGIPFYDKEILARVAEESDMSEEFVKNHEENPVFSWEDVQMWCLRITKTATVSLSTVL